jgi:hypothetical protein
MVVMIITMQGAVVDIIQKEINTPSCLVKKIVLDKI